MIKMSRKYCPYCKGKVYGNIFYICSKCGSVLGGQDLIKETDKILSEKFMRDKNGNYSFK